MRKHYHFAFADGNKSTRSFKTRKEPNLNMYMYGWMKWKTAFTSIIAYLIIFRDNHQRTPHN